MQSGDTNDVALKLSFIGMPGPQLHSRSQELGWFH